MTLTVDNQFSNNQGPQGPQKLSSLKALKIQKPPSIPGLFTPSTIKNGFLIEFQVETRRARPNRSKKNGVMPRKAKMDIYKLYKSFVFTILD